ncbi:hypothetical protein GCM10027175_24630 [Hymenobacter latericoloratus]
MYCLGGSAVAQEAAANPGSPARPAYLRLGLGSAYDIDGYYRSARLTLEYAPTLNRHLGLASRVVGVLGKPSGSSLEAQLPNQKYKAAYLEQEIIYYPLGTDKRVLFGVGAGGFAGYYRKNGFTYLQATDGRVTDYQLNSRQGLHAGYLLTASLEVALGQQKRWLLGAKSTLRNGIEGNTTTSTHSLTLGRRL